MIENKSDERKQLELKKLEIENKIRALKLEKRRRDLVLRADVCGGLSAAFNELRMAVEGYPAALLPQLAATDQAQVNAMWMKAVNQVLANAAEKSKHTTR